MSKFKNEVLIKGLLTSVIDCDSNSDMLLLIVDDGFNKISVFVPGTDEAKKVRSNFYVGDFVKIDAVLASAILKRNGKKTVNNSIVLNSIEKIYTPEFDNSFTIKGLVVKTQIFGSYGYVHICVIKDKHAVTIPISIYGTQDGLEAELSDYNEGDMVSFDGKIQTKKAETDDGSKRHLTNFVVKSRFPNYKWCARV